MLKILDFEPGPQTQSTHDKNKRGVGYQVEPEVEFVQMIFSPSLNESHHRVGVD